MKCTKELVNETLSAGLILATIVFYMLTSPVGCGGRNAVGAVEADVAYLAEQLACVDNALTKNEATACRNAVKARWATVADAGSER